MVSLILHACVLCVAGIQHSCTDEGNSMITLCAGCEMKYETNTNTLTAQRMIENIASAISSLHSNRGGGNPSALEVSGFFYLFTFKKRWREI